MIRKVILSAFFFALFCGASNLFSQVWEYSLTHASEDERHYFFDAMEMSDGNIAVASEFYYRSGFGDFYSAHPAVTLISPDGIELARNNFFRPGYTSMSYAPYLFENDGELFALSTYSPEHDPLSFNHFLNYDNPPTDAIIALYKLDENLNLLESYEHSFPIDTFEKRGNPTWEYLPNEYSGNIFLFSAFEDEGDIIGAYMKTVSWDYNNPRGNDTLFFFRMNFKGEIVNIKGYEQDTYGGWYQSNYRRNHIVATDSHYIFYDRATNGRHGTITYYDKEFNYVTEKYMTHPDYNIQYPLVDPLRDITVVKANDSTTYLSVTASNIQDPSSDYYNDCRLYKLDDNIETTPQFLSTDNYIIRGNDYTYDRPALLRAVDVAPDNTLYLACNYDIDGKPYSVIEHLNADLDTISTFFYDNTISSIKTARGDGNLIVNRSSSILKLSFGHLDIEEAHAHGLHLAVVYPNPGGDVMNIRTGLRNATLSVYDMQGRMVHQQEITDDVTSIDASNWTNGTYVWELGTGNGTGNGNGSRNLESGKWVK